MEITLEHVSHTYQPGSPFQAAALCDVSLTIRRGDFLALIGHTGSGKSTLAQHINGLLRPTAGRVLLDGQDIEEKGFSKKQLRQRESRCPLKCSRFQHADAYYKIADKAKV